MTKPCQSKLQAQAPHYSLIWETLSIAFEGKEERHFPRQFSWIKDSFQPTGSSLITIGGKYLWLFPTIGPSKTSLPPAGNLASHSCCKTPIGDFLRLFAVLWSEIYIIYCVYVTYFKLLLRLFAVFWSFRKVQFDQNVNCSDGDQFYFANFAQVIYFVTLGWWWWSWVCVCFVRWWKWTWTKFWAKVCFIVCQRSWESFSFFLLHYLFLIKGLL